MALRNIKVNNMSREIGWSPNSNLLYQLLKTYSGENGMISNEIGWGTETKLIAAWVKETNCKIVCVTTTSTTTTPV